MAKSRIEVVFLDVPYVGDFIGIDNSLDNSNIWGITEWFVAIRAQNYQTSIGYDKYNCAYNFFQALNADFGNSGLYNFSLVSDTVTITSTLSNAIFTLASEIGVGIFCDVNIFNETEAEPILITSATFSNYLLDSQNKVTVSVLTSLLADEYIRGNNTPVANTVNPIVYQILRGSTELLVVKKQTELKSSKAHLKIVAPDLLSTGNTVLNIISAPNGSNLTVDVSKKYLLNLEYSLDGTTWQTSNLFTGLLIGNYTVYVRDQFSGLINKTFSITAFEPNIKELVEFCYLSKSMSIRYKRNQAWDYNDIHRNSENTLSCEEDCSIAYKYKQKFKPINVVKTQFLSNYKTISANVIKEDGLKDSLVISKKINFLDIKDKRDARMYSISPTETGIYYTTGNTYDYTTSVDNGDYTLNGSLPKYGVLGGYIKIGGYGSWLEIKNIIYNEALDADVLVVEMNYSGTNTSVIVSAEYNQKNFDVYEFTVDFSQYNNQEVQIEILQSSDVDGFTPYNWLSEVIEVKDYHDNSLEIKWANDSDTLVFYSTKIHNVGNFEFSNFALGKDDSLEIHKTPYTAIVIEADNNEVRKLLIEDVTTEIAQQLVQVSLHKYICINGIMYITKDPSTLEHIPGTNLYSIELTLLKLPPSSSYQLIFS